MRHFDVIVVGAGPAGLNVAKILGEAGKKVLVIEKNLQIGPKVCAGGLTRKSVRYLDLPSELIDFCYDEMDFFAPHVKTVVRFGEDFFYTIDRTRLGQWQLGGINREFVSVLSGKCLKKIEGNNIVLEGGEKFSFERLVGADGSNSFVRRYLGLKSKKVGVAIQYILPVGNFSRFQVHLDSRLFRSWYAWVFPHKEYVSLGYGYPGKCVDPVEAERKFQKWASKKRVDLSNARREAFIINCDYKGFQFGNIFLVGDAAGLASGFTGEGIYQALVSAEEVANMIIDKNYQPHKIKEVLRERAFHHLFLRVVIFSGFLRNAIFDIVALSIKNKFLGRTLMRILS